MLNVFGAAVPRYIVLKICRLCLSVYMYVPQLNLLQLMPKYGCILTANSYNATNENQLHDLLLTYVSSLVQSRVRSEDILTTQSLNVKETFFYLTD